MSLDARKNFALSTVATAPSPATSGTSLSVASGGGAFFPAAPFNAVVWPTGANPTNANAEIVRVTSKGTGDNWTITRTQESTSARSIVAGDQIMQAITNKTLSDIEAEFANYVPTTRTVNGYALSANIALVKADVGLGNVDNTSDATKNAATATLTNKTLTEPIMDRQLLLGSASVPSTPASGYGRVYGAGTTAVRPRFMNNSGTEEEILTYSTARFKTGTFNISSTGSQNVTGIGFTPKMIEFEWLPEASTSNGGNASGSYSADGQFSRCTYNSTRYSDATKALVLSTTGTSANIIEFTVTAVASGQFTINVTAISSTRTIWYKVWG